MSGVICLTLFFSCQRNENEIIPDGQAVVNLKLDGLNFEDDLEFSASTNPQDEEQIHIHPISKDMYIESKLEVVTPQNNLKAGLKQNSSASLKELKKGVKYLFLVYNAAGSLVTSKEYIYKQDSNPEGVLLSLNVDYTFVIVSARSSSYLPTIDNINDLNTAKVSNANANLLYWKKKTKLNVGDNYLNARLTSKFSEVTTTLKMDNLMTGAITKITNPTFGPVASGVTMQLVDGATTYGSNATAGQSVEFPTINPAAGVRTITSEATAVNQHLLNAGIFKIGTLEADGESKPLEVRGLSFKPGVRYNLILTLKTCTQNVSDLKGLNWNYPEVIQNGQKGIIFGGSFKKNGTVISFDFLDSGADYGFVYDVTHLDNALNLSVNGHPILGTDVTTTEIQFQTNAALTSQNIEFEDGSQYEGVNVEGGTIPAIYFMEGTASRPIIRIVISRYGEILMYGSKRSGGVLYPLRLKNGLQFNTVHWNGGTQTNSIKATTRVEGLTVMKSTGVGKKKVPCTK